ncbi:MAG: EAL domain-containing protein, partial [Planctomycetota bacterium]
ALIRWDHKERGEVPPSDFIPLAEELNIIGPVGEWVVKQSCTQIARWRKQGFTDAFININLSRAQLYDGDLVGLIREQIDTHRLDPAMLNFEITETMVVNDVIEMGEKLQALKELGVKLALDDFGTGHSSLNVLQELPLDILKIDRTFIANAGDAVRRYGAIIATITELAQNLNMYVIAEGIERQEQVSLLQGLACDYAQGWLFSRAVTADEAVAILAEGRLFSVAA